MQSISAGGLAFLFHAIIETPAAISFICFPDKQLPDGSPAAKLILRQYGGLLLSTVLISLALLARDDLEDVGRPIAVALGSYHLWPTYRAYCRCTSAVPGDVKGTDSSTSSLGGPMVHLIVHLLALGLFLAAAL